MARQVRDFQLKKYPIAWGAGGAGEEEYNDHLRSEN